MAEYDDRENFIPLRKAEVVNACCADGKLDPDKQQNFRDFCKILESYYHFEHYELTEKLKDSYYPFNPDKDTNTNTQYSEEDLRRLEKEFLENLTEVLEGANFEKVSQEDLELAMEEQSLFTINLDIDFNDFEQFLVFKRGEHKQTETLSKMLGFKKEELVMDVYNRVVLYIQFKDEAYFKEKGKLKDLQFDPGSTILKLFKNIPKADMEMLFPNAKPKMSKVEKAIMGGVGLGAGIPILMLKVLPAVPIIFAVIMAIFTGKSIDEGKVMQAAIQGLVALAALGGYLFKQYNNYKNKKLKFSKILSDNLYFRNLDNNTGVFFHLIDASEEEECKEAMLAYYFLSTYGEMGEEQLDDFIEKWFEENHNIKIDFEVDDAVGKLERIGIGQNNNGVWSVLPLDQAKEKIDEIWDNIFSYNG